MTRNAVSWTIGCACVSILILTVIALPAGAAQYDASSGPVTIANGDSVYIHGVATGNPRNGLQLWIISHNYLKVTTLAVNDDDTYLYELRPADTQNLASGEYFFLVQHPMMNSQFDVYYDPSTGRVINRQLDGGRGMAIFTISGAGSLQGPDSALALIRAINNQNIDDIFAQYSFYISPPNAFINPIGDHYVGDRFTISGSTNLAAGDELQVEITSSSFKPTDKSQGSEFSGASGVVKVVPGTGGHNSWSFDVDATGFRPDEYIVKVSGIVQDVTGSTYFTIIDAPAKTIPPTAAVTTLPPVTVPATTTPIPTTAPATRSPIPFWAPVLTLVVAILLKNRQ
jgi:hypothetical protein